MSSLDSNVNRVAQLCNLVSRSELNGAYVTVESYNPTIKRYSIRTLATPTHNSSVESTSILVNLSHLVFKAPRNFSDNFPHAQTQQQGTFPLKAYTDGTILDFSSIKYDPASLAVLRTHLQEFQRPCRVVGAAAQSCDELTTVFPFLTVVQRWGGITDAFVEFENIHFQEKVLVMDAKQVKFKFCRFSTTEKAVRLYCADAVFENCLFERSELFTLHAEESSRATVLNCTFNNGEPAVRILKGGTATLVHCTFLNGKRHVFAGPCSPEVEILNCTFTGASVSSVFICDDSNGSVVGCRWDDCDDAVKVEGRKKSTVHVVDCVLTSCRFGIGTRDGKVALTIVNTVILYATVNALCFDPSTRGSVNIERCILGENYRDMMNMTGDHCDITIDGVLQRKDDYQQRMIELIPEIVWLNMSYAERAGCTVRQALTINRANKKAGTGTVICERCKTVEPPRVKFSVCGKCKNVCYCTRECQVAHWKAGHKEECGTIRYV